MKSTNAVIQNLFVSIFSRFSNKDATIFHVSQFEKKGYKKKKRPLQQITSCCVLTYNSFQIQLHGFCFYYYIFLLTQQLPEIPEINIKSRQKLKIFHSTAEDSLLLHIKYRPCQTIVAIVELMIERFGKRASF